MKNRIISLIVILALLAFSLIFGMIVLMNKDIDFVFGFNFGSSNMKLVDSYENKDQDINGIKFDLYSTDVEIKESEDELLKVEYYSNKDKNTKIEIIDSIIIIDEEKNRTICFGICRNQRKIVVYLPSDYLLSFNITTKSGDIKSFVDLEERTIDIKTTSGDIILKNTTNISLNTTSGDIKMNNTNKANINTTSGDIEINSADILNIKTTSGDMKIDKVNDYLNINTTSGDIIINSLALVSNSNIKTTSGDIIINDNIGNCYIEFNTRSGNNHINKSDRKSDVVLNVNTTSGDIRVN